MSSASAVDKKVASVPNVPTPLLEKELDKIPATLSSMNPHGPLLNDKGRKEKIIPNKKNKLT